MLPIVKNKYFSKSITNPNKYVEKYKNYKYFKFPKRCIITYPYIKKIVEEIIKELKFDFIKYSNFFVIKDFFSVFISSTSSPNVACLIEELRTLGVNEIINTGIAAGISDKLNSGDIILVKGAFRDEGTSYHYIKPSKISYPSKDFYNKIKSILLKSTIDFKTGYVWTTDAPYRETDIEINYFKNKGTLCVDMESSAVFCVCNYYGIKSSSVLVISDIIYNGKWNCEFDKNKFKESFRKIFNSFLKYDI